MEEAQQSIDIFNEEIVIFENGQHPEVCCKAQYEVASPPVACRGFYQPACNVIDYDDSKKNQEVCGYEGCVKIAAGE